MKMQKICYEFDVEIQIILMRNNYCESMNYVQFKVNRYIKSDNEYDKQDKF